MHEPEPPLEVQVNAEIRWETPFVGPPYKVSLFIDDAERKTVS